jgi:hypothetical protein
LVNVGPARGRASEGVLRSLVGTLHREHLARASAECYAE